MGVVVLDADHRRPRNGGSSGTGQVLVPAIGHDPQFADDVDPADLTRSAGYAALPLSRASCRQRSDPCAIPFLTVRQPYIYSRVFWLVCQSKPVDAGNIYEI